MTHVFEVEIAEKYGVNAAIVLNLLRFWIAHNAANKKNVREGRTWTYNSNKAWAELVPYLSEKQVRTAIDVLLASGFVVKANFNESTYDRTLWYALTEAGETICPTGQMDMPVGENPTAPEGKTLVQVSDQSKEPTAGKKKKEDELTLEAVRFVTWFVALLVETGAREPRLTDSVRASWAECYEKMIRIDGRDKKEVASVCRWVRNDNFWSGNFMSPMKLRDKKDGVMYFDIFLNKIANPSNGYSAQKPSSRALGDNSNIDALAEYEKRLAANG